MRRAAHTAWGVLLVCGGAAAQQPLTLSFSAPERVQLLAPIRLEARLHNGGEDTQVVRDPVLDVRAFVLRVRFENGVESRYTAFHPGAGMGSNVPGRDLAPGDDLVFVHEVPALACGRWTFRPEFHGVDGYPEPVTGEARTVVVVDEEQDGAGGAAPQDAVADAAAGGFAAMRIETRLGAIEARFRPDVAPGTCLHVAALVRDGFYDRTTFHRVIAGFMIQGGNRDGQGQGYSIPAEFSDTRHVAGVLSMARLGDPGEGEGRPPAEKYRDSARTSFFICDGTAEFLDGRYTAFGEVTDGMETVHAITGQEVVENDWGEASRPVDPVRMDKVTLVRRR